VVSGRKDRSPLAKALEATELTRIKKLAADPSIDAAVVQEVNLAMSLNIRATPDIFHLGR